MSNCIGCKCNACVFNALISPGIFTPGEIEEYCYNCEDHCDHKGSGRYMPECDHFRLPKKLVEQKALTARSKLKVTGGNPVNEKT